jgi:hypothetical protein
MSGLFIFGIFLVSVAVGLKYVYSESKKELLILQIGQNIATAGADPSDGSVTRPTNSLADLIVALITESNQQSWLALAADVVT